MTTAYLLPGLKLVSPLLQQLVVLLVQMLQLQGLVLDQQVALLVLKHNTIHRQQPREAFTMRQ